MPQMTAEAPTFQIFPADTYEALCKEITPEDRPPDRYHDKPYVQLKYRCVIKVDDDESPDGYEWKQFTFWTEIKAGAGGKLNKYRVAIGLPPVDAGESFNTDDMTDKYFRLTLDDKKRDGTPGQTILAWLPAKRKAAKTAKVEVPAEDDDDGEDSVPF